jgi:DNA-binding transcriptional MerR regulator
VQSGKLARLAGVSTDTLRHYERLGLLPRPRRATNGYRDYAPQALERVRLVRRALSVGFSLAELSRILAMRDHGRVPCHEVRAMAKAKLQGIEKQIEDLLTMRRQLERIVKDWNRRLARTPKGKPARLLETLPESWQRARSFPATIKPRKGHRR